ncbi:phage tail tape measure protein [Actinomadura violacea]|uniref:Phage tail tape measure protein n=1 Tax=Actinomadura violacea TaxID=2819934 RepID=A0ABS3RJ01_9ACTN|nr:phage tail tape measure protein [Actinomadura violacea]MBO2456561.1 phage tail tape measure protein [Actinomadura violacea]
MALDLGELVATVALDDKGFTGTLATAERGLNRLESTTKRSLDEVEQEYQRAGDGSVRQVRQAMNRMEAVTAEGGRAAGKAAAKGVEQGLDAIPREAKRAGEQAGEKLAHGTESKLGGLRSRLRTTGKSAGEGAGEGLGEGAEGESKRRFGGLGGKLAGLVGKAGPWLAAGTVVGGVLMKGLEGALEKQDAMAKLKASVGAFGPDASRLGKIAGTLYSHGYGESMGEVTESIQAVIQQLGGMRSASKQDIQAVSASAMDLANIMGEDVGNVIQSVSQMLRTGMASSAKQAFDILTVGIQQGGNKAEDLLDTFNEYSTQFRRLGLDGKTAMALISQGLKAGARDSDQVADAIGQFGELALTGGSSIDAAFKSIGLNSDVMAKKIGKGGSSAKEALAQTLNALRGTKDEQVRLNAATALFGDPGTVMGAALFALDPAGKAASQALGKVSGAADKASKTLHQTASQNLTRFQRTMKTKVTDFMGGQVLPGLTKFGSKANAWFQRWVGDNGATVEKVKRVWSKLSDGVGRAVAGVKKWLDDNKGKIDEWSDRIGKIVGSVADIVSSAIDVASKLGQIFGPTLLNVIGIFVSTFLGYWSGLFQIIQGVWNVFAGIFTGDWGRVWKGIKQIFSGAVHAVWSILKGVLSLIWAEWKLVWSLVKGHVHTIWNAVVSLIKSAVGKVKAGVHGLASLPGQVAAWFGRLKDGAVSKAKSLASWMKGLPGRIKSALGSLGSLLRGAGRNVISGLISGIKSKIGDLGSTMGDIAGKIRGFLPFSPAKEGPLSGSGNPEVSGAKIGAMLATGIASSRGRVAAAMSDLTSVAGPQAAQFTARGSVGAANATRTTTTPSSGPTRVIIDLRGLPAELKKWIRKTARTEGGGSVQIAFGQERG